MSKRYTLYCEDCLKTIFILSGDKATEVYNFLCQDNVVDGTKLRCLDCDRKKKVGA